MEKLIKLDRYLYVYSQRKLRVRWANLPMVFITQSGTKGAIWLTIGVILVAAGGEQGRSAAVVSVASLLAAEGLINLILKPLIARERPYAERGPGVLRMLLIKAPRAYSWPSAHAGSSVAAAIALGVSYPAWAVLPLMLAALIAYSRVYVGVHYPLDVIAGSILGIICAALAMAAYGVWQHALPGMWH